MNAETEECIDKQERLAGRFQVAGQRRLLWDENGRPHSNISLIVRRCVSVYTSIDGLVFVGGGAHRCERS
jgi:hypothetical protein